MVANIIEKLANHLRQPGDLGEAHSFASRPRDRFAFCLWCYLTTSIRPTYSGKLCHEAQRREKKNKALRGIAKRVAKLPHEAFVQRPSRRVAFAKQPLRTEIIATSPTQVFVAIQ